MSDYFHTVERIIAEHLKDVDTSVSPWPNFLQGIKEASKQYEANLHELKQSLAVSSDELVMANEEMHAVFQAIPDQLIHLNDHGQIIAYKSGLSSHHYFKSDQLINKNIDDVVQNKIAETFNVAIQSVIKSRQSIHFEFMVEHEDNSFYYEVRIMLVKSHQVILLIRDITERKSAEEQIAYLAYHDSLTGLPNTRLFKDRLIQGLASAKRKKNLLAVLFLDLDRFKVINDTMGHSVGDRLLQETSNRLLECVRSSDSVGLNVGGDHGSSVARMGGDEFTIMLEGFDSVKSITNIAQRLIDKVREPVNLDGLEVYTSTSIGVAVYPHDGDDVGVLLRNADAAMYHAKDQGKNNFQFYTESMNQASAERLDLENSLRKALGNDEFLLYYQSQVDVLTGKVVGMEALIRWKHPVKGFISPAIFIPLAEDAGLIVDIGEWVIIEACRQLASWMKEGYEPVKISVNLSAKQLQVSGLCKFLCTTLEQYNVPVRYLSVELTETAIILEPEIALNRLNEIKELGIQLSLDDFGTGYSSLSYLRRFPIDTLKIDQVFIRDIKVDHEAAALVKAIISMAHSLGMDVVAEGVETQDQLEFLSANGCDMIQGYLFSKPVPAEELKGLLIKYSS